MVRFCMFLVYRRKHLYVRSQPKVPAAAVEREQSNNQILCAAVRAQQLVRVAACVAASVAACVAACVATFVATSVVTCVATEAAQALWSQAAYDIAKKGS